MKPKEINELMLKKFGAVNLTTSKNSGNHQHLVQNKDIRENNLSTQLVRENRYDGIKSKTKGKEILSDSSKGVKTKPLDLLPNQISLRNGVDGIKKAPVGNLFKSKASKAQK